MQTHGFNGCEGPWMVLMLSPLSPVGGQGPCQCSYVPSPERIQSDPHSDEHGPPGSLLPAPPYFQHLSLFLAAMLGSQNLPPKAPFPMSRPRVAEEGGPLRTMSWVLVSVLLSFQGWEPHHLLICSESPRQ